MKQRILTAVVVVPLFITLSTTPAYGISAQSWRASSGRK